MKTPRRSPVRHRDDQGGAALVELAIAVGVLSLLLFGIITFGVTLSYSQSLTQAANEAGRAAAVAPRDRAVERAEEAAAIATGAFGATCNEGRGLTCSFVIEPCPNGPGECMVIELVHDLRSRPLVPTIAVIDAAVPDRLVGRAIVEVEPA